MARVRGSAQVGRGAAADGRCRRRLLGARGCIGALTSKGASASVCVATKTIAPYWPSMSTCRRKDSPSRSLAFLGFILLLFIVWLLGFFFGDGGGGGEDERGKGGEGRGRSGQAKQGEGRAAEWVGGRTVLSLTARLMLVAIQIESAVRRRDLT